MTRPLTRTRAVRAGLVASALSLAAPVVAAHSLRPMKPLLVGRSAHTATTLRTGHVLVAGGMVGGGQSVASMELVDPVRNTVREAGRLAQARLNHSATLLPDGRVVMAGGYGGSYLASVEVVNADGSRVRPGGSLRVARSGHTATLLGDGRILLTGGVGKGWTFLSSAEIYDPATGRSALVGSLSAARESHTATLLEDGRVLVVGGHQGRRANMEVFAGAEVFDTRTGRFEPAGVMRTPRHKHDAVRLADGRVLVVGGADHTDRVHFATTEVWVPRKASFQPGPKMAQARYKIAGTSIVLPDGDVLLTGGARVVERLSAAAWEFQALAGTLPAAYRFAAAAILPDGSVLVTGGYDDSNANSSGVWRVRAR